MIQHHPHDEWLLGLAAGRLARGPALVVDAHVEGCAHCQARVREFEVLGGATLETLEPATLAPDALARTLARLDAPPSPPPGTRAGALRATLPDGVAWPRSLNGCSTTRWRWLGPGMRWSRITLPSMTRDDPAANLFLLRIGAGKNLPVHTHSDAELTQVLYGTFHDGRARFGPGDFDATDAEIRHQPVVDAGTECICLASVTGRLVFDGAIARALGALVGM